LVIGLEPLRAAVITHFGRPGQAGAGPARMLDSDGVRHPLAKFADVINVYLNSGFAVTSQAAEETAKNEPLASNQRGVIINTASIAGFEANLALELFPRLTTSARRPARRCIAHTDSDSRRPYTEGPREVWL
jgi:NAD(P)-dependent dehydrogenase (short-subunit alcohol dehydrogenase family)